MHDRLKQVGDQMGVPFTPREHAPSTKKALAIAEYAREQGKLAAWREAGMNAHWRDGRDIEDEAVLRDLAEQAGLDPDEAIAFLARPETPKLLMQQRIDAARWGVTGIPTWFMLPDGFDENFKLVEGGPRPVRVVGCQPLEIVERAAQMAGAKRRADGPG